MAKPRNTISVQAKPVAGPFATAALVGTAVEIVEDAVPVEDDENPVEVVDENGRPEDDAPVAVVCRVDDVPSDKEALELPEATVVDVPLAPEEAPLVPVAAPLVEVPLAPVAVPLALIVEVLLAVAVGDKRDEGMGMLEVAAGFGDENDPDMPLSPKLGE
jgi:hypothetical protein